MGHPGENNEVLCHVQTLILLADTKRLIIRPSHRADKTCRIYPFHVYRVPETK